MPSVDVYDNNREVVDRLELREDIFAVAVNPHVLHEVVLYQLAKRRSGTAKVKGRSEVKGGGRKPWRQKGTGRARSGTSRSPIWRGGGTIHGPQPRDYTMSVPKKVRKLALKMALSQKLLDRELTVVDRFGLEQIRTRDFIQIIDRFKLEKPLVVIAERDEIIEKSARNIPNLKVLRSEGLNVYDVLNHHTLVLTKDSVGRIEEALSR
ncbi:MAG: 50S ribosomal protein L4 [Syntrophobacteraceae bacterium CG2_30_61_12]|nr:MAG: 50S ribosomal protein L4 [Syntrophobacteraceae bacterium CG2_30_61_12]PIU31141.1 MAG: 50S ribosomal protein L4 [Syntrophobacteraceae bacterium CG07_land_8_20_14_0_80_61_8]